MEWNTKCVVPTGSRSPISDTIIIVILACMVWENRRRWSWRMLALSLAILGMRLPSYKGVYWELLLIRKNLSQWSLGHGSLLLQKAESPMSLSARATTSCSWDDHRCVSHFQKQFRLWDRRLSLVLTEAFLPQDCAISRVAENTKWSSWIWAPESQLEPTDMLIYTYTVFFEKLVSVALCTTKLQQIFHLKNQTFGFFPCKIM